MRTSQRPASPVGEDDLQAFIDGRLPAERIEAVETWLARNPDAAATLESDRLRRLALQRLLAPILDEPIPTRLRVSGVRRALGERPRRALPAMAFAASLLLFLAGGAAGWAGRTLLAPPASVAPAEHMADAAAAWRVFANDPLRPVELRPQDGAEFAPWISARLGRRIEVPDLDALGLRFIGGRLLATEAGAAALFLYDDDRGARVSVYVRPVRGERPGEGVRVRDDAGAQTRFWYQSGFGYAVTGPADAGVVEPATRVVREAYARTPA